MLLSIFATQSKLWPLSTSDRTSCTIRVDCCSPPSYPKWKHCFNYTLNVKHWHNLLWAPAWHTMGPGWTWSRSYTVGTCILKLHMCIREKQLLIVYDSSQFQTIHLCKSVCVFICQWPGRPLSHAWVVALFHLTDGLTWQGYTHG
jgi:hypothetical protein